MAQPKETQAKPILEKDHWLCKTPSAWERGQLPPEGDLTRGGRLPGVNPWVTTLAKPTLRVLPACSPSCALAQAGGQRTRITAAAAGTENDTALTAGTSHIPWVLLYLPVDPPPLRTWTTATYPCSGRLQPETRCRGTIFPRVVFSSHSLQQQRGKKSLILDAKKIHIEQLPRPFCKWNLCFKEMGNMELASAIMVDTASPFSWFTNPPSEKNMSSLKWNIRVRLTRKD